MFIVNDLFPAFRLDALASSHPISVHVENPADIATIFDLITYCKVSPIVCNFSFIILLINRTNMTLFYFNILPEEIYIVRFLFAVAICA
jgi:hypothetical protein